MRWRSANNHRRRLREKFRIILRVTRPDGQIRTFRLIENRGFTTGPMIAPGGYHEIRFKAERRA